MVVKKLDRDFIEIFNEMKDDIYRLVYSYMKNTYDTDDIIQNVFIKLYNQFHLLNDDEHIKRWLIRVSINECKSHFLSSWRKKIIPLDNKFDDEFMTQETLYGDNDILQAVLTLPKKYRIVVHLYYYEDYKIAEIAEVLKIKETTIQTQLQRAREKLKNILKEDFDYE